MATSEHILTTLGGISAVSRDLSLAMTTVQDWKNYNFIPEWRKPALLALAMAKGVPLSTGDFPTLAERIARKDRRAA